MVVIYSLTVDFNPRTHVGCDWSYMDIRKKVVYFNPRTHVGCDDDGDGIDTAYPISIHAPMWGATRQLLMIKPWQIISIHAPMWGATTDAQVKTLTDIISIHAPMWGATLIAV